MGQILEITSAQNPRYKNWLKALEGRGIKKNKEAILSGKKFLAEVLTACPERVVAILARHVDELNSFIPNNPQHPLYILSKELFAALDIYGTDAPLLVISAPQPPVWDERLDCALTLFLPFQNPINLGTIIRSAAALDAKVVVLKEAANIYHPKTLRAAGPAIFSASIKHGPSLAELAEISTLPLYALSLAGNNIFNFDFPEPLGLVAGMEGPGLENLWPAKRRLTIPMQAAVESLNAAASVDIALGAFLRAKQMA